MITSVRFCLSNDLFNAILAPSKFVNLKKTCIVVTDVVKIMMMLLVIAESVMLKINIDQY